MLPVSRFSSVSVTYYCFQNVILCCSTFGIEGLSELLNVAFKEEQINSLEW